MSAVSCLQKNSGGPGDVPPKPPPWAAPRQDGAMAQDRAEAREEMDLILRNARPVGAERETTDIGIAGGRIADIRPGLAAEAETLDLQGRLVSPGLIETHIHLDKSAILDRC